MSELITDLKEMHCPECGHPALYHANIQGCMAEGGSCVCEQGRNSIREHFSSRAISEEGSDRDPA